MALTARAEPEPTIGAEMPDPDPDLAPDGTGREPAAAFEAFFRETEPKLRRALVAAYGPDLGREAASVALSYAWEH